MVSGNRNRYASASGSDIANGRDFSGTARKAIDRQCHQQFGFRSGNQDVFIDAEGKRIEFAVTDEVGNRFTGCPFPNPASKGGQLFVGGHLVKSRIEFDSLTATCLGQQDFGIQPG